MRNTRLQYIFRLRNALASRYWFCLVVFALPGALRADWKRASDDAREFHSAGIEALDTEIFADGLRAELIVAIFSSKKYGLRIRTADEQVNSAAKAAEREHCVAAINGGYFREDRTPVGLLMVSADLIHPLGHAPLLSGVLLARANQGPEIIRTGQLGSLAGIREAVQSGPFLVDRGVLVRGLESTQTAARSFAFVTADGRFGLGICRSVTLAQLSRVLTSSEIGKYWRITRALNLDGGSSTDFFLRIDDTDFSSPGWIGVQNYIIVTRKAAGD